MKRPEQTDCPSAQELLAFHLGTVSAVDVDTLASHVSLCAKCESALSELDGATDDVVLALRQPVSATPSLPFNADRPLDDCQGWPTLPGFEVTELLGKGGMGVVYRARQLRLNRPVALKRLRTGGEMEVARQRVEAEALARLTHRHIVRIFEFVEHAGASYLVLELVEGGTLSQRLTGKPVPPREAAELARALAEAVHHAHEHGIVHRDLKPGNVLLSADGEPKITDFGLAKQLTANDGETKFGDILGTPAYMAPEQAGGKAESIGPAADIYSLGVILYELLTGRVPIQGLDPIHTLTLVKTQEPVPPRKLNADAPRDLETVCLKCLMKEPGKRYATAADLADDLRRWLDGRPIIARPVPVWERVWLGARRRPFTATMAAVALLALVLGATGAAWQWREAVQARHAAEGREAEANEARTLAELREARRAIEKGLLLCDRGDVGQGLEWLDRGRQGAERAGDTPLATVAQANIAAWSTRLPTLAATASRVSLPRLPVLTPAVEAVAYNRTGEYLATAGDDLSIEIRRASGDLGVEKRFAPTPLTFDKSTVIRSLRFSPVSDFTLAVGHANGYATVWDVTPGREPRRTHQFKHPQDEVWSVAFSPDGASLATGCDDGLVRVWPLGGGPPVSFAGAPKPVKNTGVQSVTFVPPRPDGKDDRLLLAAGREFGAALFRADGTRLFSLGREEDTFFSVAACWTVNGLRVFVGADRLAQLWHVTGHEKRDGLWTPSAARTHGPQLPHPRRVTAAALTTDGLGVTADHGGTVRLWDVESGRPLHQALRNGDELRDAALRPNGRAVAVGSPDGVIRVWNLPPSPWPRPSLPHDADVIQAYFDHAGRIVTATAASVGTWTPDYKTRHILWQRAVPGRSTAARTVTPGPAGDGFFICSLGDDKHWLAPPGVGGGAPVAFPRLAATDVVFAPNRRGLLTLYSGFTVGELPLRWWELSDGKPHALSAWGDPSLVRPLAAAFLPPDGREVLVGCASGEVIWLDAATGRAIAIADRFPTPVTAVAYRADGSAAVVGCQDGTVRCLASDTRSVLGPGVETGASVRSAGFSPDGSTLLIGLSDGTARVWDVAVGLPIGPALPHLGPVNRAVFAPDGQTILTAGGDGAVRTWTIWDRLDRIGRGGVNAKTLTDRE